MGMSRRASPGIFAVSNLLVMIICIPMSIGNMPLHSFPIGFELDAHILTWWPNIFTSDDTYIKRNHINIPEKCDTTVCGDWCSSQCSSIGRPVAEKNCQQPPPYLDCQCCCKAPTPGPSSSPSPSLPPNPSSPPPSDGKYGQEYVEIKHNNIEFCALQPQCENKFKEKDLLSAVSQCLGSSKVYKGGDYSLYEHCCCANIPPPPPPPPTPSPPPCSSCGSCCMVDINIQISVKQGSGQSS
ncbi:hypothetical protein MKW98_024506 [Papaver atlanticum]|uniref:Uncharacterized protein n=1 Tax=Papaver atlanticum TaxID=357466 RepID=A0AAD4RUZ0_9MAGN|nr:hypothetical protein MKW98_024506 [Papaver atlanticum]